MRDVCFGNHDKLRLRYIGPLEILEYMRKVSYCLPAYLEGVHNVFHVLQLKRCVRDETYIVDYLKFGDRARSFLFRVVS